MPGTHHFVVTASLVAGLVSSAHAQLGSSEWLWTVTTDDGDAIVEPGERATVELSMVVDPDDPEAFIGFAGASLALVPDAGANSGKIVDAQIAPGWEFDAIGPVIDGAALATTLAQDIFNEPFIEENPVQVFELDWTTTEFDGQTVGYFTESATVFLAFGGPGFVSIITEGGMFPSPVEEAKIEFQVGSCPVDFDGDGVVSILDFIAYQSLFVDENPAADCTGDGAFNVLDFICAQGLFQNGCE